MKYKTDMLNKLSVLGSVCKEPGGDIQHFKVPLVYVKGKQLFNINSSNRMMYQQRMSIKNKYKKIIEPEISKLKRFSSGHIHLIAQIVFSDQRRRDVDNMIPGLLKWVQDSLVENEKLDDDKYISFTFLPPIYDSSEEEHYCEFVSMNLIENEYFIKVKGK